MSTGRGRTRIWWIVAVAALLVSMGLGWTQIPAVGAGDDFDVVSAVLALVSLSVAAVGAGWAARAQRHQETSLPDVADRLAVVVLDDERRTLAQLLDDHDDAIDLRFVLAAPRRHRARGAENRGRLDSILTYYTALQPRRLVITGEPGSGKTVLALQLLLRLLETRQTGDAVPVRLTLASWQPDQRVEEWIAHQLVEAYGLSHAGADELVKSRRVLPVFDGLDEMERDPHPGYDSRVGQAVRALNKYQQSSTKAPLVITCRTRTYRLLQAHNVRIRDAACIEIEPVTGDQACAFLDRRVEDPSRWQRVFHALQHQPHGPLAQALSTPWRLNLAATAYEQRDENSRCGDYLRHPDFLVEGGPTDADGIGFHLRELLIPAATSARNRVCGSRHTPEKVRAVLTALASHLRDTPYHAASSPTGRTDILPHQLWTLAGWRRVRRTATVLVAAVSLPAVLISFGMRTNPALVATLPFLAVIYTRDAGPAQSGPVRLDVGSLLRPHGRRWLGSQMAVSSMLALRAVFAMGLVWAVMIPFGVVATHYELVEAADHWPVSVLLASLGTGVMTFLIWMASSWRQAPRILASVRPENAIRNNTVTTLALSLFVGALAAAGAGIGAGRSAALEYGLWAFTMTGLVYGQATLYYVALLLTTRRGMPHLPWRFLRFLKWLYEAGLLRKGGMAYQFRHRELQDHLTR